ncbi:unnamed protein product [Paramecium sonneborni]|uniref:Uncharacterized protein n=1 Tax=Paramecium sonneborni TaxID=65129 RepID=A0A8S1PFY1_9CILI|nr:unnamed protein product [Paramecium sonneborni]
MNCGQCIKELKGFQFDEKAEEYQGVIWDGIFNCFYKKKFKIEIMNQSINYISNDGQILRIDQRTDCYQKPKILTNLDQIKHLQKYNICEQNMNNTKRINLMWKGEALENNGGECCTYIRIKIKIFQRAYQQFLEFGSSLPSWKI